ncbi:major facilitator superfamily transporter [Grosmannia clavigera kw1407]|uniref:Major facilitator superfamily transporter n=1 Tax=Grosmannia clavigera (strain kw1407 / UAMH 11150) TaxID=655863 RepID=F0XQQ5_GROCL|nr:major facilitator superfamily transporter [Grosmannia clavigera kw1407]EFW99743.1 major facilitator superfamily transporter [Grosmannia clavigera kw1407]
MSSVNEEKGQSRFSSGDGSALDTAAIGLPPDPDAHLNNEEKAAVLSTSQYNMTLTIFFISYSVFEPLTNIMLKRLRPSVFIPIIMVGWGASMLGMGFAIFFSAAAVSGSFGGLLAAAIELMDGIRGRPGWAWIFILEGLFTILAGIVSFFLVHDFPDNARFLTSDDRVRVVRRLKLDQQSSAEHEEFRMSYFWSAVRDWKMWLGMVIYMGCDMPLYAFSLFLPSIIKNLGWSSSVVHSQLMSVPPYAAAAILTILIGYIADRTHARGLCNIAVSFFGIAGFSMLLGSDRPGVQYAGTFLGAMGIYPCISNTISWMANNIEGVYKRGVVLGFVIGWGNLNGIVSSNIFFDSPRYFVGHGLILAYMVVFLLGGSLIMTILLRRENSRRIRGERNGWTAGLSDSEIEALGDRRPDFLYTT